MLQLLPCTLSPHLSNWFLNILQKTIEAEVSPSSLRTTHTNRMKLLCLAVVVAVAVAGDGKKQQSVRSLTLIV